MSSDDQATTEDRCSELGTPVSIPSVRVPDATISKSEARMLAGLDSGNSQLTRELRYRLKQANKTMGKQGQTIANLRGELARIREENSKIDRGELRRLERVEADTVVLFRQTADMATRATEEIKRLREENALLREKLEGDTVTVLLGEASAEAERLREELAKTKGHVVTGQHAADRAAAELEDQQ